MDYDRLLEFCTTTKQQELIKAIDACHGNVTNAVKMLGWEGAVTNYSRTFRQIQERAAKAGHSPSASNMRGEAPVGFTVKRHSARFDKEGNAAGGWLITEPTKKQAWEAFEQSCNDLVENMKGLAKPVAVPKATESSLLTVIPIGDPHFGMMSWAEETGENFDLAIAERLTVNAVDRLTAMTPKTDTALLLNLGDFYHADNSTNRTPRSGVSLDVDGRFQKIASVGFRAMIRCVDRLLEKHRFVIVRNNRGNHDPHQAAMLTMAMDAYYHNEPRVEVEGTPSGFYYHRYGKNLLGSTHGDGPKLADLPLIMANDRKKDWGETIFRTWHTGHVHHDQVKEFPGCMVETHRTMAATDAWHSYQGYRSGRDLKSIIYHRDYGEMSRSRCGVEMLEAA